MLTGKIYMYHNENTKTAIWSNEKYYSKSSTNYEFEVMAGIHETVRVANDSESVDDLLHGVKIMLATSGNKIS